MCGCQVDLRPPHHKWDRFCPNCGSRFVLHDVDEEADYVVSQTGIGDVLGGDAPKITFVSAKSVERLLDFDQHPSGRGRQRDPVQASLLGGARRLGPYAIAEVELLPPDGEHFRPPGAGQQQQLDDVRSLAVGVRRHRGQQPFELVALEVAMARRLGVALDPLDRVVGPHFPDDGETEHA